VRRLAVRVTAFFCVAAVLIAGWGGIASADSPPLPPTAVTGWHFHIDAGFRLQAAGDHPYSDTVEETREESGLRIIAATAILIAILQNIHGRHVAKMHHSPPPCMCQSATPSASAPIPMTPAPSSVPSPTS